MTHVQNSGGIQSIEKHNGKKELYQLNTNLNSKETPMIESRYDIGTLRAISESMLAKNLKKSSTSSYSSRDSLYSYKKRHRSSSASTFSTSMINDMGKSYSSLNTSLTPTNVPFAPQARRRCNPATSLLSISPTNSPTTTINTRHLTYSVQPRWHNQACMLFLALRQHPKHEMPRTELINAALELDKNLTPKNSASAILTNDHGKHFQSFRPYKSRSMHFRLTFKPANLKKAANQYREWLDILYKRDWPLCFGKPQQDFNKNKSGSSDSTSEADEEKSTSESNLVITPKAITTTTTASESLALITSESSELPSLISQPSSSMNEINNKLLPSSSSSLTLNTSVNEGIISTDLSENTKQTSYESPSAPTDNTSMLPTPPTSNSPSFDQSFNDEKNQEVDIEKENKEKGYLTDEFIPFKPHETEFDHFMALRQQERERLNSIAFDEYDKENQYFDTSMLPSPTYSLINYFNDYNNNTDDYNDQQQHYLNGTNISICDTIQWTILGDDYYLTSSDTPDIPKSWRDIVRVEHTASSKGDTYCVYTNRRLPMNIPIGFYFGAAISEEEFGLFKEDNGQALAYSIMYGNTILDPTDDYGKLFTNPDEESSKIYCPFNFIREADTPEKANILLLKGRIHNQVICWTKREIRKDEELLTWVEYSH
ncbi:unnamed protein product [Cunninghamella blakesleeana]